MKLWVDFSSVDREGRIAVSVRFQDGQLPVVGEIVDLDDDEGLTVQAVVEKISEGRDVFPILHFRLVGPYKTY